MADGEVKKVSVYITSDGSVFLDREQADEYEQRQEQAKKVTNIFLEQQKMLNNNSSNLSNRNGYYRMVSGQFFGTNDVYDAITSLVIDDPELTKDLITSIEKIGG